MRSQTSMPYLSVDRNQSKLSLFSLNLAFFTIPIRFNFRVIYKGKPNDTLRRKFPPKKRTLKCFGFASIGFNFVWYESACHPSRTGCTIPNHKQKRNGKVNFIPRFSHEIFIHSCATTRNVPLLFCPFSSFAWHRMPECK